VVEVATSSESYDLHDKKDDYERAGGEEYLVVILRQEKVLWYRSESGRFVELPGAGGILRSAVFPGLWLDPSALLRLDGARLREVLHQGLASDEHASDEHARFVEKLAGLPQAPRSKLTEESS
jgi:hypothetical protein